MSSDNDDDFDLAPAASAASAAAALAALAAAAAAPVAPTGLARPGRGRKGIPRAAGTAAARKPITFKEIDGGTKIGTVAKDALMVSLGSNVSWRCVSTKERKKSNSVRCVWGCGFAQQADCPFVIEVVKNSGDGDGGVLWTVRVGEREHSDHSLVKNKHTQNNKGKKILSEFPSSPTSLSCKSSWMLLTESTRKASPTSSADSALAGTSTSSPTRSSVTMTPRRMLPSSASSRRGSRMRLRSASSLRRWCEGSREEKGDYIEVQQGRRGAD